MKKLKLEDLLNHPDKVTLPELQEMIKDLPIGKRAEWENWWIANNIGKQPKQKHNYP